MKFHAALILTNMTDGFGQVKSLHRVPDLLSTGGRARSSILTKSKPEKLASKSTAQSVAACLSAKTGNPLKPQRQRHDG
ncbi:hypothetical protein M0R45_019251 [Rubus argutus]|uniref:Uncharacterized protein n=1 Tax=Rubus argutus TaxID=59490 RepID=A0AAW1X5C1_RUBAR